MSPQKLYIDEEPSRLTSCIQNPAERQLDILEHMARDLDMPHIRRMVLRSNIIMLQNPRRVKQLHER